MVQILIKVLITVEDLTPLFNPICNGGFVSGLRGWITKAGLEMKVFEIRYKLTIVHFEQWKPMT